MSISQQPSLVSVIVNNYNYGRFLPEAIESILHQTYPNIEIVVVDDGSTDDSREIIESYGQQIIPVLKRNGGQASAFNAGFQKSTGEIICFLDSDDTFEMVKCEQVVALLDENQDLDWYFHPLRHIRHQTQEFIADYPRPLEGGSSKIDFREKISEAAKMPDWGPATSGMCFRRTILESILPMPEIIKIASDNYLRYAAVFMGKGFFCNEPLSMLRIHGDNSATLRYDPSKLSRKAEMRVLTAYWIRENFPGLKKLSNKLIGMGIGELKLWEKSQEQSLGELIDQYLDKTPLAERLEIRLRSFYHYLKNYRLYKAGLFKEKSG